MSEQPIDPDVAAQLERASDLRHSLRNRLSSIRYATFYVQRRVETTSLWTEDPRMQRFFAMLTKEIGTASALISQITLPYLLEGIEPDPEPEPEAKPEVGGRE